MQIYSAQELRSLICGKLRRNFAQEPEDATAEMVFKTAALVLRDIMTQRKLDRDEGAQRQVHYLSLEFLVGRSLMKNAHNLGLLKPMGEAIESLGFAMTDIFETEPDAALGNGGLGRLAAAYLEAMTTLEIPATGYSICYELGIFKQKLLDGEQVELPDHWLELGDAWLLTRMDEAEQVRFGGTIHSYFENGRHKVTYENADVVLAVPRDMPIAGYDTEHVNYLRLWDAKSPAPVDMSLYSRGEYLKAIEQRAMAEVIAKVLYPDDNHYEGKSLRLKQQYFFVSATIQCITRCHRAAFGDLGEFHRHHVIQINDTHPALAVPELMRILLDEEGMAWDEAWEIVTRSMAYTNHTVMAEALERWPQGLMEQLLPRIWQILQEINSRYQRQIAGRFPSDDMRQKEMAIIWDGQISMANLCIAACFKVNGVSELHSKILREDIFHNPYLMMPEKFTSVTNGIDHRRWMGACNPGLDQLVAELLGGREYLLRPQLLSRLEPYADDAAVRERLGAVKRANKLHFAEYVKRTQGIALNTDAIFDVQAKRLHEYKRQLLNAMHIIYLYERMKREPEFDPVPRVFLFGAKAAPGYAVAKRIIRLIGSIAREVNSDPVCRGRLQVVFLENYRVSLAEQLMPAAELSEQISTAGKEASGTGNMKFMLSGALTIGTLDGANLEMHAMLGDDNIFIFGLTANQVRRLQEEGYNPYTYYNQSPWLPLVFERLGKGFSDGVSYADLAGRLLFEGGDQFLLLADFESYRRRQEEAAAAWLDKARWNRMAMVNIALSGAFSADRSIADYADGIWKVPYRRG